MRARARRPAGWRLSGAGPRAPTLAEFRHLLTAGGRRLSSQPPVIVPALGPRRESARSQSRSVAGPLPARHRLPPRIPAAGTARRCVRKILTGQRYGGCSCSSGAAVEDVMGTDSASSVGPGRLPGEVKRPSRHRPAVTVSDSPGFLLNQAVLTLNGSLDRALAPSLTGAQWTAVWLLHERRISTASELARAVGTDVAAAWRLAGRLADKGYLARSPDPADRRAVQLSLTPAAVEACPAWRATVAATLAGLLGPIVANGAGAPDTYPPAAPPVRGATPAQPQERNRR